MGKKSVVALLAFLSTLGFTLGVGSCDSNSNEQTPIEVTIEGFDVQESINVNVGAVVELEQPIVTDSLGVLLDCWTYVTDANGNYVATTANSFMAENIGVYTITYVVRDSGNNTYEKKTLVNVQGEASVGEVTIKVDFEQFIIVGETTSIEAVCSNQDAELTYSVKKVSTGSEVTVDGTQFVAQEAGLYEINVATLDGAASYKYNVFAEKPLQEGEVERFDESWAEKESFVGGKRQGWEIVTTEESGIVDPYGRPATFAKYSTDRAYIPLFINIREDVAYYEQLAKEGYTKVSMWIYMQSKKPHITISDRDPNGGFYRREGPDLHPGEWTEFRLDLITGKTTWYRSFVQCYPYYANQNHFYLQVDNSYEYNPWGGGDNITFYFTDIFAVKDVSIAKAEEVETQKSVKDTVDVSSYFSADFGLDYSVTYRGVKTALNDADYVFTANGEYTFEAVPSDFNLRGSEKVTVNVSDLKTLNTSYVAKERTTNEVTVSLSELNAAFAETDQVVPTIDGYKVFYNGEEISVKDNTFTASKDGVYTVEIEGSYEEEGVAYKTYHTAELDIWSEATKYEVFDVNNMKMMKAWSWGNASFKFNVDEYTVDGKTDTFMKADSNASIQSLVIYGRPFYTKAYYEQLLTETPDMEVYMNFYHIPGKANGKTALWSVFTPLVALTDGNNNNEWQAYTLTLSDFVSSYDNLANEYELKKNATHADGESGNRNAWIYITGGGLAHTVYFNVKMHQPATEATVTLKDGAALTLDTNNDLRELLDVSLDGEVGEIKTAEVYFNNEWVALEDYTFNPAWELTYQFRFDVETVNGLKYKQVELTLSVGDSSFVATNDSNFYAVKAGETFDASTLLSSDYTYNVKLMRSVKGVQTLVKEYETAQIDTTNLSAGMYTLNIYATRGESAFSEILYYTLTLDVWTEEAKYVVLDTENMKAMRAYNWGSTSFKLAYGEYEAGGKTGNFVRSESYSGSQSLVVYGRPLYSKGYYEWLLSQNDPLDVAMNFYHEPNTEGKRTALWSIFTPLQIFTDSDYNNTWQTYTLSLEEFISKYDSLVAKYEAKKNVTDGDGESGSNRDAWVYITDNGTGHIVYFNATIKQRPLEATEATLALKDGAKLTIDTDNNLSELLNVTLDGEVGQIKTAEIYFNNEWVALEDCIFNPAWELTYQFRFNVETANGLKYKQVELALAVGEGSFTATNDTKFYGVKAGDPFNASDILSPNYTYRVKLMRSVKGVTTVVGEYDAAEIDTTGLSAGMYTLNVYATREGNKFSEILYYTLTLDVWTEETKYSVLDTKNMRAMRAYDWGSTSYKLSYGEYEVGGKTGSYVKSTSVSGSQSLVIYGRPLYSKGYYEWLLSQNANLDVLMNFYHTPDAEGKRTALWSVFTPLITYTDSDYNNTWQTYTLTLADFIASYDSLVNKYEAKKNATEADGGSGGSRDAWVYITDNGVGHTVYFNVNVKQRPLIWSAEALTIDMLTTYQYGSSQNRQFTSITTEIPEGGVAGTYVKWAQTENKQDIQLAVAPVYTKDYYESLLASGKKYKITYDVYVEITTEGCECIELATKLWYTKTDGTNSFATQGKITIGAWHTVEVDLQYLVNNWGNYRLFGLNFCNQTNFDRTKDFVTFYLGNIQLVEGEASGVATPKNV